MAHALRQPPAFAPVATQRAADEPPARETTTLVVDNMYCGSCIHVVEEALLAVPGVSAARVNLSARRVSVEHASERVLAEDLVAAVSRTGYTAAELTSLEDVGSRLRDEDLMRRLGVAGFAMMNIMLLSVSVWSGAGGDMEASVQTLFHWVSALIALPAVAYAGQPFFASAAAALGARRLNMDVPISLGVILATLMSLYQTVRGSEQVYFDAAVSLLAFLLVGRLLDQQVRTRALSAAANFLGLKATSASVVGADGGVVRMALKALRPGMDVLAAAGERIAADGVVVAGASEIDESLITGETALRRVGKGGEVFAGTVNIGQPITIRVTRSDDSSVLAEIARLMAAAEQGRGRYVRLADRAARVYAPAVHLLGLTTFLGWLAFGHGWEPALTAAIAVLIITCPCALALAVPAVQVVAASRLFGKGAILKAADGLERMAEVDTIVFDKTGTLTLGEPRLAGEDAIPDATLAAAAGLAAVSRHPYSRALHAAALARGLEVRPSAGVSETPGCGLSRVVPGGEDRLGSAAWCGFDDIAGGGGAIWFKPAIGAPVVFRFADVLRPDARDVVQRLVAAGYAVEILSGDRPEAVAAIAAEAGIGTWRAGRRPDEKIARLDELKAAGHRVLMVGDGLNDAPALAAAHASLSPASAADISQTAADAIFQGGGLAPVVECLAVAKAARRYALQNFGLAIAYNVVFVPLAMVGIVTPLLAAIAMSASSITVTANAVRLRARTLELRA